MIHSFVEKLLMGTSLGAIQNWVVQGITEGKEVTF